MTTHSRYSWLNNLSLAQRRETPIPGTRSFRLAAESAAPGLPFALARSVTPQGTVRFSASSKSPTGGAVVLDFELREFPQSHFGITTHCTASLSASRGSSLCVNGFVEKPASPGIHTWQVRARGVSSGFTSSWVTGASITVSHNEYMFREHGLSGLEHRYDELPVVSCPSRESGFEHAGMFRGRDNNGTALVWSERGYTRIALDGEDTLAVIRPHRLRHHTAEQRTEQLMQALLCGDFSTAPGQLAQAWRDFAKNVSHLHQLIHLGVVDGDGGDVIVHMGLLRGKELHRTRWTWRQTQLVSVQRGSLGAMVAQITKDDDSWTIAGTEVKVSVQQRRNRTMLTLNSALGEWTGVLLKRT